MREIVDDLGFGYHAIVPQFCDYEDDNGDIDIGLGIYRFRTILYSVQFRGVERKVTRNSNGLTNVEYITPFGTIRTGVMYNEAMRNSGATLAITTEHAIKGVQDFEAVAYIFENAEVKPNYSYYQQFKESVVGDRGLAVDFYSLCASPMHFLMKELMAVDTFFYELYDHSEEMEWMAEKLSKYCNKIFEIAADSPAEMILSGANYDSTIQNPPLFEKYIVPSLKRQSEILHEKGKFLITHTDSENIGLLDLYLESNIDVADSICPEPMTKLSLKEIKDKFAGGITIWGGIPSTCLPESVMTDYEFEKHMNLLLESIGNEHFGELQT